MVIIFRDLLNNLELSGKIAGFLQFRNMLQLHSNQLCQDFSVPFFEKVNTVRDN